MNNVAEAVEGQLVETTTAGDIMLNEATMARLEVMATRMASAKVTVPEHLQGNEGDCFAIIMQAVQWGMSPFVVAQKTHMVKGTLGYEAQLVNAVVQSSGLISGGFHYEYKGEAENMECRVGAILRGQDDVTWGEWLVMSSVTTRNSPLWKTNPKQQMGYLQVKNWSRLYAPGAILGVYTVDELRDSAGQEREISPGAAATSDLNEQIKGAAAAVEEVEEVIEEAEIVEEKAGALTYAIVADAINNAANNEEMAKAAAMAGEFTGVGDNDKFREELTGLYKAHRAKLDYPEVSF